MFETSIIELSESALRKNLRFLRQQIGPEPVLCSVIKGNAYGHGIEVFVPMAERCGVRQFAVFDANEAFRALRSRTQQSDILIMGDIDDEALAWALENRVAFYVFDLDRLRLAIRLAQAAGIPARVHLEVETGLNRTGLHGELLTEAVDLIRQNPVNVQLEGVCTHLAGAETVSNYLRITQQIGLFEEICLMLQSRGISPGRRHMACSAAAFNYPQTVMEMVRFGIAQYGFWSSQEMRMHFHQRITEGGDRRFVDPLRRVMCWRSRIMTIKAVAAGLFVGYGTTYLTTRRQRIASVPVGYFHGFPRQLSNLGHVLVQGRRAPVVGTVSMNMMMVDVTDVPEARQGDEVVIIGRQRKAHITVSSFSDLTGNLNYEVLVRLPAEIPRVVVE